MPTTYPSRRIPAYLLAALGLLALLVLGAIYLVRVQIIANAGVTHTIEVEVALTEIKRFATPQKGRSAEVLLVLGEKSETTQTVRLVPTPVDYWVATTYPRERAYRAYFLRLERNRERSLIDAYRDLGERFPHGLADVDMSTVASEKVE